MAFCMVSLEILQDAMPGMAGRNALVKWLDK